MNFFKNLYQTIQIQRRFLIEENQVKFPNTLLKIALKNPDERNKTENEYLYNDFKNLKYFQNILNDKEKGEYMYSQIIKRSTFKFYKSNQIIYNLVNPIEGIFYIVDGQVSIYKEQKKFTYKETKKNAKKIQKFDLNKNLRKIKSKWKDKLVYAFKFYSSGDQINKEIDYIINKGDEYGSFEIKNKYNKRHRIVVANTDCLLGFINKLDYILIFDKIDYLEKTEKRTFLLNVSFFKIETNSFLLNKIFEKIQKIKFNRNNILCKKGDIFNGIYIIISGSFRFYFNSKKIYKNKYNYDIVKGSKFDKTFNISTKINNFYITESKYEIINFNEGEKIGLLEYYLNNNTFLYDIICNNDNSEVYFIPIKIINNLFPTSIKEELFSEGDLKYNIFIDRILNIKNTDYNLHKNDNKFNNLLKNFLFPHKNNIKKKIYNDKELCKTILLKNRIKSTLSNYKLNKKRNSTIQNYHKRNRKIDNMFRLTNITSTNTKANTNINSNITSNINSNINSNLTSNINSYNNKYITNSLTEITTLVPSSTERNTSENNYKNNHRNIFKDIKGKIRKNILLKNNKFDNNFFNDFNINNININRRDRGIQTVRIFRRPSSLRDGKKDDNNNRDNDNLPKRELTFRNNIFKTENVSGVRKDKIKKTKKINKSPYDFSFIIKMKKIKEKNK